MKITVKCPYCGKERKYYIERPTDEDGRNYAPVYNSDKGCDCLLGKLDFSGEKIAIKPMCFNCKFHKNGECINEQMKEEMSTVFSLSKLSIKDLTYTCSHYELNRLIFDKLIDLKED